MCKSFNYAIYQLYRVVQSCCESFARSWNLTKKDFSAITDAYIFWRPAFKPQHSGSNKEVPRKKHLEFIAVMLHAGRKLKDVPADGSCFLHVLSKALMKDVRPIQPATIRKENSPIRYSIHKCIFFFFI